MPIDHYAFVPQTEREKAAKELWQEINRSRLPPRSLNESMFGNEAMGSAAYALTDGHGKRLTAECLRDVTTVIREVRVASETMAKPAGPSEDLREAVRELGGSLRDLVARLRADGEWEAIPDGHAQDLANAEATLKKHGAALSGTALTDGELDDELVQIRQIRDQALTGDRDALAEFGRRFDALGPKLRAKEREMAKTKEGAGRDRAFEECAEAVLAHVGGELGQQLAEVFRARKTASK